MSALIRSAVTDFMSTFSNGHTSSDQSDLQHGAALYGLTVHRHSTRKLKFPSEEGLTTNIDLAIMCCEKLKNVLLDREENSGGGKTASSSQPTQQSLQKRRRSSVSSEKKSAALATARFLAYTEQLTRLEKVLRHLRHLTIVTRRHPMLMSTKETATMNEERDHASPDQEQHEELSYEDPVNTVATFNAENRGFMLLVIHTLTQCTKEISSLQRRSNKRSWFFSHGHHLQNMTNAVVQCCQKLDILIVLGDLSTKIAENRYTYLERCLERMGRESDRSDDADDVIFTALRGKDSTLEGQRLLFPFADGFDIDSAPEINQLDYAVFMEEMGTQYMPMVGTFFNVLVRTTAAHKTAVSFNLSNDYLRQGLLGLSQLRYIDGKSASKECVKFFREASAEHTLMLWESLDTGIVQYFNYFTLLPIPTSRIFHIGGPIPSKLHQLSTVSLSDEEFDDVMERAEETGDKDAAKMLQQQQQQQQQQQSSSSSSSFSSSRGMSNTDSISHVDERDEHGDKQRPDDHNDMDYMTTMDILIEREQEQEQSDNEANRNLPEELDLGCESANAGNEEQRDILNRLSKEPMFADLKGQYNEDTQANMMDVEDTTEVDDDDKREQHTWIEFHPDIHFDGSVSMKEMEKYTTMLPMLLAQDRSVTDLDKRVENIQLRLIAPWDFKDAENKIKTKDDWGLLSKMSRVASSIGKNFLAGNESSIPSNQGCMIMHIHGGGFVAMSSYSHESYVRRWAYQCNIPIVSVDYRKSPGSKYPSLIAECYESYKWVIQNAEHILGQPLKRLIIAGDSAGANLAMVVCNLAIRDKIRVPDALVLSYPVTLLAMAPSSGRIMSLIDPLVNFGFLKMCGVQYLGNAAHEARTDPYISPAVTPSEILSQYPPVYFGVGTLDPLFDDAVFMAKRVNKYNGGRVTLEVYDGLPHGYLNMAGFVPGGTASSNNIVHWVNRFFSSTEEQE